MSNLQADSSTKPYFIRALHQWCTDQGFSPYIAVSVDDSVQVPRAYVKAGEIVLNVSYVATNRLEISNEFIQFEARFNGQAQQLIIPISHVSAIFAKENGHGMAFDVQKPLAIPSAIPVDQPSSEVFSDLPLPPDEKPKRGKPKLAVAPTPGTDGDPQGGGGATKGKPRLTRVK